jgi:hypothetical protein
MTLRFILARAYPNRRPSTTTGTRRLSVGIHRDGRWCTLQSTARRAVCSSVFSEPSALKNDVPRICGVRRGRVADGG